MFKKAPRLASPVVEIRTRAKQGAPTHSRIISGNTHALCCVIGEKAADMMMEDER